MSASTSSRRLRTDAYIMLGAAIVARGGLLVTQILTARLLGVDEFNVFVTATVVGSLIYTVSDLGLTQAALVGANGDPGIAASATRQFCRLRIATATVSALVGVVVVYVAIGFRGVTDFLGALAVLITYSIQSLSYFWRTPLLAETRVSIESRVMVAERTLSVALGIMTLVATRSFALMTFAALVGALAGLAISVRVTPRSKPAASLQWTRSAARWGLRFSAAVAATTIYARLDYLIIAGTQPGADAAAYAAAYSLVIAAYFLPMALSRSTLVHFPSGGDHAMRTHRALALAVGSVGALAIAGLGPQVVRLAYGLDNPRLGSVCAILGAAFFLMALNSGVLVAESFRGSEQRLLGLTASAAVVNALLCIVLIPREGITGAAIATVATEAWVAAAWRLLRKRASLRPAAEARPLRASWANSRLP